MVNNLINNLFADFIHVAKVMNYTYNATIQPFIDRGIILIYSAIKGSIDYGYMRNIQLSNRIQLDY